VQSMRSNLVPMVLDLSEKIWCLSGKSSLKVVSSVKKESLWFTLSNSGMEETSKSVKVPITNKDHGSTGKTQSQ
jgi:hypothetical protein